MGDKDPKVKMMTKRDKMDDGTAKKLNLPSKEDSVLDLGAMEERRLALRLGRLDIESKTQLKHLARETREVREIMRKQQMTDTSQRGSLGRLNLPPIGSSPLENVSGKKLSTSTPPSPRSGQRSSKAPGNTRRRSSSSNVPVGNIIDSRRANDTDKLVPIIRRMSSGQSLPIISNDSPDSVDSADNHSGASTPPMISIERCTSPVTKESLQTPPRRLNRLEIAPSSIKYKSSECLATSNENYSKPLTSRLYSGTVRQTKSDSNLTIPSEKSVCCLDPRFQRLTSVLVPSPCQNETAESGEKTHPSSSGDTIAADDHNAKLGIRTNTSSRGSSQRPARLVPIQYDSKMKEMS
ncbi:uncharacterized protein LOC144352366 [Saccoglossus kowalevskii]